MRVSRFKTVLVVMILLLIAVPAIAGAASISGRVRSGLGDVGGATVTVYDSNGPVKSVTSNDSYYYRGYYSITGLPAGTYTISYSTSSRGTNWHSGVWLQKDATSVTLTSYGYGSSRDIDLYFVSSNVPVVFDYNAEGLTDYSPSSLPDVGDSLSLPDTKFRLGYDLAGWYRDEAFTGNKWNFSNDDVPGADSVPAAPLTLFAKWTIKTFDVGFNSNGGSTVTPQEIDYNDVVTEPDDPTLLGRDFKGWYTDAGLTHLYDFSTPVTSNLTLYAKWAIKTFDVDFDSNDGSAVASQEIDYNNVVSEPTDPTRTGYDFEGWYTDEDLTDLYDFSTQVTSDLTLYAKWDTKTYTVSFNSNGGGSVTSQDIKYLAYVSEPSQPQLEGYTFDYWFLDDEDVAWDFDVDTMPAESITLHAHWTIKTFDVAFVSNSGSAVAPQEIDYNGVVTEPVDPIRLGHDFEGWYSDAGLTHLYDFSTQVTSNLTLYAKWDAKTYTVSFDSNGGTAVASQGVKFGQRVGMPLPPTRIGYYFAGWYTTSSLATPYNFDNLMPAGEITLYAKWAMSAYPVSFESNGGSGVAAQYVAYGSYVVRPADPTRDGFTFEGWYADAALTAPYDFSNSMSPSGLTLYAKWKTAPPSAPKVTFDSKGGSAMPGATVGADGSLVLPEPTRDGFKFLGWYDAPKGGTRITSGAQIKKDSVLYARWVSTNPDLRTTLIFTKLSEKRVSGTEYSKTLRFYYATKVAVRRARTSPEMKTMYQVGSGEWQELSSLLITVKPGTSKTVRVKTVAPDGTTSRTYTYKIVMVR